jgi:hypothetical protein
VICGLLKKLVPGLSKLRLAGFRGAGQQPTRAVGVGSDAVCLVTNCGSR